MHLLDVTDLTEEAGMDIKDKERAAVDAAMNETFGIARNLVQWDDQSESFYLTRMPYELHGYRVEVTIHKPG